MTRIVSQCISSPNQLPLRLYQIGIKYRRELRPRNLFMRMREFYMKDLYTFDVDEQAALRTYEEVFNAYVRIFRRLSLEVIPVLASSGDMGGKLSHEFQFNCELGEDEVLVCLNCGHGYSSEYLDRRCCSNCSSTNISSRKGLELGHTFYLGTRYSDPFRAVINTNDGTRRPIEMGCYGIGVSRLISALAEAHHDQHGLRWPEPVAPFKGVIIIDDPQHLNVAKKLHDRLVCSKYFDQVAVDERQVASLGWKIKDAYLLGIPHIFILGKRSIDEGRVEYHRRNVPFVPSYIPLDNVESESILQMKVA